MSEKKRYKCHRVKSENELFKWYGELPSICGICGGMLAGLGKYIWKCKSCNERFICKMGVNK
jgi:tRNA(Ile2) C34 agmatinyltransferase TiaS